MKIRRHMQKNRRQGFTLIELLVVISIIGILASLILPGIMSARRAARRAQCENNLKNLGVAFTNYLTNTNKFPASGYIDPEDLGNGTANVLDDADLDGAWDIFTASSFPITDATSFTYTAPNNTVSYAWKHSWVLDLLPFLEHSDMFDQWDNTAGPVTAGGNTYDAQAGSYLSLSTLKVPSSTNDGGNNLIARRSLGVLVCPEDVLTTPGQGNLSYVVNGGFSWHWMVNDDGTLYDGGYNLSDPNDAQFIRRARENRFKMGLMFLDTKVAGGTTQVHRRHTSSTVKDGVSTTIMLSENANAGVDSNMLTIPNQSNWANPHPFNTSFFVNPVACETSDQVNNGLGPYQYSRANRRGRSAPPIDPTSGGTGLEGGINGDLSGVNEGQFPYPVSFHSGGVHVCMCDGSVRYLSESIDALIWARLVTPDGARLVNPADLAVTGGPGANAIEGFFAPGQGWTQLPLNEDNL